MKYFLIHGSFGNPEENWFPWLKEQLEKDGNQVIVPKFPTPENQSLDSWLEVFEEYKNEIDKNTIFVGHSLGPAFILSVLENIDVKVKGCIFVAGFLGLLGNEEFDNVNKTFTTKDFDWNKITSNCEQFLMFNSDNDPYVPLNHSRDMANGLGIKLNIIKGGKHLNASAGFTKFPELLSHCKLIEKQEKVFMKGELGKVCGVLHKVNGASEITIIVHGFSSNKESGSSIKTSLLLNNINISTLRIDLDNQGESELDFETGISIHNYIKQIEAAIFYCKSLNYKEISLVGTSFGGISVFATAMYHSEIKRMVLRCPVVDYQRHLIRRQGKENMNKFKKIGIIPYESGSGKKYNINYGIFETSKDYSMFDHAKDVKMPTLIIQGTEDEAVDWTLAKEVVNLFPNAKLHVIEGAKHSLGINGDFSESQRVLVDFFKE